MAQALQNGGMLLPSLSLQFRVHTRVFVTLVVALAIATLVWAEAPHRQHLQEAIAVQNGIAPMRVIRIDLGPSDRPTAVNILEAAQADMADPTLGVFVNGEYVFVANAGWNLFQNPGAPPAPRSGPIFHPSAN